MTSHLPELPNLHDVVLPGARLDWGPDVSSIALRVELSEDRELEVVAHGVKSFSALRTNPWGPSDSILDTTVSAEPSGRIRLEVEMQSGDVITVVASSIRVVDPRNAPTGSLKRRGWS